MFTKVANAFRKSAQIRRAAIFCAVGLAYYAFVRVTGFSLFCPFQKLTGFACPGCGISHFLMDILELRFIEAFRENVAVALLLPVWAVCVAVAFIRGGASVSALKQSRSLDVLAWVSVGVLIVFGVVRNLPGCEFLLPSYLR